ncbi:MAG: alpha/beta hydrolase [Desulfobacterales bacterium]|jgi:lysophospholipase
MIKPRNIDGANVRIGYFTTADGTSIRNGLWSPERKIPRGSVVLLSGRKEFLEKYTETAADLNQRGFAVFGFDWRGQGLSSRMLPDRLKGFVRNYDDYVRDLEDFFQRIVQPEAVRPIYVLAHSMGGHVALRYLHRQPAGIDKAVLVAPMLDINTKPFPRWMVRGLTWLVRNIGSEEALVPGSDKRTNIDRPFEGNVLTSDPRRFAVEKNAVVQNPDLALGGVTFAWLTATLASIACIHRPGYLEGVRTPVLMLAAGADRVVSVAAQESACRRLPKCRLLEIAEARHEILMEIDAIRSRFWEAFDAFIADQAAHR